ncbi:MAG: hypothetical protein NVS2B12_13240 [Ktedonobacteraceae bacterium]
MNFITRSGATLYDGSNVFRFAGVNCYWLGLSDHVSPGNSTNPDYPTMAQIDDALATAKEMGCTVVRAHTLGISVGNAKSVWPTLNTTNTVAFNTIDYAIYKAGVLGLRLIIPLTDAHTYYHGGIKAFTDWEGLTNSSSSPGAENVFFYTVGQVIDDFKNYVSTILNHVNQYGNPPLAYKDDPTIMAWESGNELHPVSNSPTDLADYTNWLSTIAEHIKNTAPQHLVMDGTTGGILPGNLSIAAVDIYTNHFYPPSVSQMTTDANATMQA